jgi:hypothetical protein
MTKLLSVQEKRSDREVERLFQILERATEIKETQLDRVKLASDVHLPTLNANLEVAVGMCNRILEKEEEHQSVSLTLCEFPLYHKSFPSVLKFLSLCGVHWEHLKFISL